MNKYRVLRPPGAVIRLFCFKDTLMSDELVTTRPRRFGLILNRLGRCFRIPKFDETLLWRGATSGAAPHGPLAVLLEVIFIAFLVTGNCVVDNHFESKERMNVWQSQTDETK